MTVAPTERQPSIRRSEDTAPSPLTTVAFQQLSDDLQILAHPVRLQILTLLARSSGEVCVCDLELAVPVKQPTVSHHLRLLREAGLIDFNRQGLRVYYFLQHDVLEAIRARFIELFAPLTLSRTQEIRPADTLESSSQRDDMKPTHHTAEQIVKILEQAEKGEQPIAAICREHGITENMFYAWRKAYAGMSVNEAQRAMKF